MGALIITICKNVIKVSAKSESMYFNVYGKKITEGQFKSNMDKCGPAPDPLADALNIQAIKGAIVIPS